MDLAHKLSVKVLVFSSPKNRKIGNLPYEKAYKEAILFFRSIGNYANKKNVFFCIEPNSTQYGCDFITNTKEAIKIVNDVASKGFKIHIDSAVMSMNKENIEESLFMALPLMKHFHISEPFLDYIPNNKTPHQKFFTFLKKINYTDWVSIEMKNNVKHSNLDAIKSSLIYINHIYR